MSVRAPRRCCRSRAGRRARGRRRVWHRSMASRTASTTRCASGSTPTVRSASNTNVGESVVPVTSGHGRAELVGSVAEEARVDGRAVSRFEHRLDGRRRQHVEHVVHAGHRRLGCRVAAEAEQQQVARAVRVERRLGVEHQRRPRRRGGLAVGVAARRHDVLHDASAVLGDVSDRLAQAARHGRAGQFGRQVLAGRCARRGGSRAEGRRSGRCGSRSAPARFDCEANRAMASSTSIGRLRPRIAASCTSASSSSPRSAPIGAASHVAASTVSIGRRSISADIWRPFLSVCSEAGMSVPD